MKTISKIIIWMTTNSYDKGDDDELMSEWLVGNHTPPRWTRPSHDPRNTHICRPAKPPIIIFGSSTRPPWWKRFGFWGTTAISSTIVALSEGYGSHLRTLNISHYCMADYETESFMTSENALFPMIKGFPKLDQIHILLPCASGRVEK